MIHNSSAHVGATPITFETGKLAKLADGAVTVRCGETILLVSAVSATTIKEGQDWFPLSVDYREKAAAVGKFPGGFFRREGRPSEKEILTCRMTDRPLRPLFPKGYLYDTQIIAVLLSADGENDPDMLCINGASAALCISDIPFAGPVAAVRVGRVDGQFVANPTHPQRLHSDLDLVYVGNETDVVMIEGEALEIPEDDFIAALKFAHDSIQPLIAAQKELAAKVAPVKRTPTLFQVSEELMEVAYQVAGDRIEGAIYTPSKTARAKAVGALKEEVSAAIVAKFPTAGKFEISQSFDYLQKKAFRKSILDKSKRADGRGLFDLRDISGEVGLLPRSHGSSLFTRGETQAVALATLGTLKDGQELDGYTGGEKKKHFILHYNFPPFSVGETGRTGSPGRREIGHGALAERSLAAVIPPEAEFPYSLRVSSEIMESNGSSSMASVCAGCLALMDAGVPIKKPVAGISVGLVTEFDEAGKLGRHTTLVDIIGSEDHFGDMDFKLCGTADGVTGFQLDLKLTGISHELMARSIHQAKEARMKILDIMGTILAGPRTEMSQYAPRIETVRIPQDKIGLIIGPGGKTIKGIVAETGAEINIEDDGSVNIYSNNADAMQRAKEIILGMTKELEIDEVYHARVVSIKDFGAFVECLPGKEGLVHISELADFRVNRTEDVVRVGDQIWVKCVGIEANGKVRLSRKAAMKERDDAAQGATGTYAAGGYPEGHVGEDRPPREDRGDRPPRRRFEDRGARR